MLGISVKKERMFNLSESEYVSIVLFVQDDVHRLEKCLCHILDYTPALAYEMIVVECKDCRVVHEYLQALPNIQIIAYGSGMSIGARWQKASKLATGGHIVFLQDSVCVLENWLTGLGDVMRSHKDAAVVQPFMEPQQGNVCEDALFIFENCCMINREMLFSLGGIIESYNTDFFCLGDLSFRLLKAEKRIFCTTSCQIDYAGIQYEQPDEMLLLEDRDEYTKRNGFDWYYSTGCRTEMLACIDYTKPDIQVLDIGCSCGATLMAIRNKNPKAHLYGLELCEQSAKVAGNFAEVRNENFEELVWDDYNGKFDFVIMGDVLEHLFHTDRALQKVKQWLRPGGKLIVSVPNVSHVSVLSGALQGRWDYQEAGILDKTHVRFFTVQSIGECLRKNGFGKIHLYRKTIAISADDEKLIQELTGIKLFAVKVDDLVTYQVICLAEKTDAK